MEKIVRALVKATRVRSFAVTVTLSVLGATATMLGCSESECANGNCDCERGESCAFVCTAPPCHVTCEGNNPECEGACANGDCVCGPGSSCDLECDSEPCHVTCEDSTCDAECGNGDCTCSEGSSCDFECTSGPCHVSCEGDNPECDGECANGDCLCGPDSDCDFHCVDNNCSFICKPGASCSATCDSKQPMTQGCEFSECAAGEVILCPDGKTQVCGRDCPPPPDED